MLKVSHAQTAALVDVMKSYDLSQMSSRSVDTSRTAAHMLSVAISTMLDASMDELFVPYMEGSRYLEKETKCPAELYMLNLYPFSLDGMSVSSLKLVIPFPHKVPPGVDTVWKVLWRAPW